MKRIRMIISTVLAVLSLAAFARAQSTQPTAPRPPRIGAIGVNLETASYNYSRGFLYADAMRSAQPFPSADALGNPTADNQTVLVIAAASPAEAGTYKARARGQVTFGVTAGAGTFGPTTFDGTYSTADLVVTAAQLQNLAQIQITVRGVKVGAVTNVELYRPGAAYGDLFYKPYLALMQPFSTLRLMDVLMTNDTRVVNWSDRPTPDKRNVCVWFNGAPNGIPYEHCFELARQTGKDIWITVPVGASDDYINQFAALVAQQAPVGTVYRAYVERGNEVWNWSLGGGSQWKTNQAMAAADPSIKSDGMGDPNILGWREHAAQTIKISKAMAAAYKVSDLGQTPVRVVLAGQAEQPDVLRYGLDFIASRFGAPNKYLYGVATAPYLTLSYPVPFNLTDATTPDQVLAGLNANLIASADANVLSNHSLADKYALHKLGYEFGLDVGQSATAVAARQQSQYLPGVQDVARGFLSNWAQGGGELTCWFTLSFASSRYGTWGLVEDVNAPNTPKFQELARDAAVMFWNDAPIVPPVATPTPQPAPPAPFDVILSVDPRTGKVVQK
jgi:hypothetical protein